ncbi:MAG TPA: EsaB/YukD family protein [Candidatus Dormibacteraeota bacterium]|nr:EsaB/YukD family protein [Candidatus Dormibacteraeota bacterium]
MVDRMVITVDGPQGRAEVAVPSSLPVAEVLPIVLRIFQPGAQLGESAFWSLSRPGQSSLPPRNTLAECGIKPGDQLVLRRQDQTGPGFSIAPPQNQFKGSITLAGVGFQPPPVKTVPGSTSPPEAFPSGLGPQPVLYGNPPTVDKPPASAAPSARLASRIRKVLQPKPAMADPTPAEVPPSAIESVSATTPAPAPLASPSDFKPVPTVESATSDLATAPMATPVDPPAPAPRIPEHVVDESLERRVESAPEAAAAMAPVVPQDRLPDPERSVVSPWSGKARAETLRQPPLLERLLSVRDAVLQAGDRGTTTEVLGRVLTPDRLIHGSHGSALDRAKKAWLMTNYTVLLDQAIQGPRLHRCVTVAVTSPKGGVGKTTIAILIATLVAALRRDRVLAVDANPDYGTLGRYLVPGHRVDIDQLMAVLEDPTLTVPLVDRGLGRAVHGLMVLPSSADPEVMMRGNGEDTYRRLVGRLQELMGVIVLDCGPGLNHPVTKAALQMADQVLLVSDGDPATASVVIEAAQRLDQLGRPALVVVNRLPARRPRLDVDRLAGHLPQPWRLRVIPEDNDAAALVTTAAFDWTDAPAAWNQSVRELVVAMMSEWGLGEP